MRGLFTYQAKRLAKDWIPLVLITLVAAVLATSWVALPGVDNSVYRMEDQRVGLERTEQWVAEMEAEGRPEQYGAFWERTFKGSQQEVGLLRELVAADDAGDAERRMEALIAVEAFNLEAERAGWRSSAGPLYQQQRLEQLQLLHAKGIFQIPGSLDEMGFLYRLLSVTRPGALANFMYFLAPGVLFVTLFTSSKGADSRRGLNTIPVGRAGIVITLFGLGWLASIVAAGLIFIPFTVRSLLQGGGIGRLDYPIVGFAGAGTLHYTTVGQELLQITLLYIAGAAFIGAVAFLVTRFTDNRILATIVTASVPFATALPGFFTSIFSIKYMHLNPITYLAFNEVASRTSPTTVTMSPIRDSATMMMGVAVLSAAAFVLLFVGMVIVAIRRKV